MSSTTTSVPAGGTVGILGGGHLGRMTAAAARALGFRAHLLALEPADAGGDDVADRVVRASRHDVRAASDFAAGCDVVTAATEDVPLALLEAVAMRAPLRPGPGALAIAQDRARERRWLATTRARVVPWRAAYTRDELVAAVCAFGGVAVVKPALRRRVEMRPLVVTSAAEAARAWLAMRGLPCVVEQHVPIELEISALAARSASDVVVSYPAAVSAREHQELACVVFPGVVPEAVASRARDAAAQLARALGVDGLLAVELFLLADGRLVVNEIVPAPHPTFNATVAACATDQFEQLVRCVTGLPLGPTDVLQPAATATVVASRRGSIPAAIERALEVPGVRAHRLGAPTTRLAGPRVHLCAEGKTADEAMRRLALAEAGLVPRRARRLTRMRERLLQRPWPRGTVSATPPG